MDRVAFLGMHAAMQTARIQQINVNNLANIDTPAFKADYANSQPQFIQNEVVGTDLSTGSIRFTGRALDVVLPEGYWLAVQGRTTQNNGEASVYYTRRADFQIDTAGYLSNGAGNRVLDTQENPIYVGQAQKIRFSAEGEINIVPMGASAETSLSLGYLALIKPPAGALEKNSEGVFSLRENTLLSPIDRASMAPLQIGSLEGSNVNAVMELMELLRLSRHQDVNMKCIEAARHQDEVSAAILRFSY